MSHILRLKTKVIQDVMSKQVYPHLNAQQLEVMHAYQHTQNKAEYANARLKAFLMQAPTKVDPTVWKAILWDLAGGDADMTVSAATYAALAAQDNKTYVSGLGISSDGRSVKIEAWSSIYATTALTMYETRCDPKFMDWLRVARPMAFKFNETSGELSLVS